MVMRWLSLLLLVVAAVVVVLATTGHLLGAGDGSRRRSSSSGGPVRRVANSAGLLSSPLVARRVRRRRLLHAGLGGVVAVGLVAACVLAGRPVERTVRNEALASRDIVLCLDVSTSMLTTDAKILDTFSKLIDGFEGERVALVVWNTTAQTVVPLTDDYDLLRSQFSEVSDVLDFEPYYGNPALEDYYQTFKGTFAEDVGGSSLVGDGLASCTGAFGAPVEGRSRSIILATDNQVMDEDDEQIYSLSEAAELAYTGAIRLISLYGADPGLLDPDLTSADLEQAREELQDVTAEHDGLFYEVDDADAAVGIVKELEADQVDELSEDTEVRTTDTPERAAGVLALFVLALLGLTAWRRA